MLKANPMLTVAEIQELYQLKKAEIKIVMGLSEVNYAVMSATDHYYKKRIEMFKLVEVWIGPGEIHLWRLTEKGRAYAKS